MTLYVKIIMSKNKPIIIIFRSFYILCPNVAGFLKNCFKTTEKAHLKNKRLRTRIFDLTRTRKCAECGSDEKMRWLASPYTAVEGERCLLNRA